MADRARSGRIRGIALVLVLWVIALLTVMALGLTATQRTETSLTRNHVDTVRFRALAEAAVHYALLHLSAPVPVEWRQSSEIWAADGWPRTWIFAGETLEVRVFHEASRIDLNHASGERLEALLHALDIPPDEATALANRILDWRDPDDLRRLDGAEDSDYEAAGRPYGSKDGPFSSVAELQQILGMTPPLYRAIEPAVTVDIGSDQVDEELASALVLAALQGLSLEEAEERLRLRDEQLLGEAETLGAVARGGPLLRIRVDWIRDGRGTQAMETLVMAQPGASPPFRTRWQRYGLAARPDQP
ncbi:type II secretion system protein GspK [Thioalkalicoccus limnaeus]|uniref:Type II secretion system protein GspK n=1 Tax=Thioalkalicoccus limnaeus TaxID=120681 RepID=A0ABV4BHG3_9GAMM